MTEEHDAESWNAFQQMMAERLSWATLQVPIKEISRSNEALVLDLSAYDPNIAVPLIAGLLTLPAYQSNCIRIEVLAALALIHCRGRKRPNIGQAVRWFYQIGMSACASAEDPAEDVFVALVRDPNGGDYRILEGVWEAAGFFTQRILEVVHTMPDSGRFRQIKRSVRALLKISDIVCERSGLHRYQTGSDEVKSALLPSKIPSRNALVSRTLLSHDDLNAHDIKPRDIEPFFLKDHDRQKIAAQEVGASALDCHPLIMINTGRVAVALPSAISVAVRDFVLENMIAGGLVDAFDEMLAANYANVVANLPLLGGPMHAPVRWARVANGRCSSFQFEVDKGYVISFHLFLPSICTHFPGGFKCIYEDDGSLTAAVQNSINETVKQFDQRETFKEGLFVIAGCGWGKGVATQFFEMDHPKWRVQTMSSADLIRASHLSEMSPLHYWRIQDGLQTITKAGVNILNVNGILNLIGWIRSNHGHFVPHAQLPDGKISTEQPLILYPPTNLLRDIRALADRGYDRHSVQDNRGIWHDVQRVSPEPFFPSESSSRVYASYTDVQAGRLTAVYEGYNNYWVSVSVPHIFEKEVEFRLWEMLQEWLHRVAHVVDNIVPDTVKGRNIKIYAEFRDVHEPDSESPKPSEEQLEALCTLEPLAEQTSIKAVFEAGFFSGFRIAENTAERIIARNLLKACCALIGFEVGAAQAVELEALIVPNNEARCFHFFHARTFLDFTRQHLSNGLISIDPLDDAAAKIGLGWRVRQAELSSKIFGREECNIFLSQVVDTLLVEILENLRGFERTSTITRLVGNMEKAHAKEDHWNKTSAALLGLHGRTPDTIQRFVEQTSKFAGAAITSRVLAEMAVCECALGRGAQLSDIELSKLIAKVGLLIRIGGLSDAIRFNALPPELTISPLGDILFRNEFGEDVVEPMLAKHLGNRLIQNSGRQKDNYEEPVIVPTGKGRISDEFWKIWEIEMGFNIDQARLILDCLDDKGITDSSPIFTMRLREFQSLLEDRGLTALVARKFIDRFSLSPRPKWKVPPKGYALRDIYPWRFGRRLSCVTRPIIKLDEENDPTLLIAPNALRKGFAYVLGGAYEGSLGQEFFLTAAMRNDWWGKASEGHSFNSKVAKALSDSGWNVRENINIPEIINCKLGDDFSGRDFGDIDVLAWRSDREDVLVMESKDLSLARNYSEIAARLADYQGGERDGKADKLKRHLDRVSSVKSHADRVAKFTGVERPRIVSWLVCSGVVPMQFAKIEALNGTSVGSIEDVALS